MRNVQTAPATIGARIQAARENLGWRLRDLADLVHLSVPYLSDIENDRRNLPRKRVAAFAKALSLSEVDLVELDPATLAVVEAKLLATGRCARAVRVVREMAGGAP
jgi:transcriptional regulator with XRE-family HTH domain